MNQSDFFQFQQEYANLLKEFSLLRDVNAALQESQTSLLNQLSMGLQANAELRIENQTLRDEIARLKKTSLRPKIPPSGLEGSNKGSGNSGGSKGGSGRGKHPRNKKRD